MISYTLSFPLSLSQSLSLFLDHSLSFSITLSSSVSLSLSFSVSISLSLSRRVSRFVPVSVSSVNNFRMFQTKHFFAQDRDEAPEPEADQLLRTGFRNFEPALKPGNRDHHREGHREQRQRLRVVQLLAVRSAIALLMTSQSKATYYFKHRKDSTRTIPS